MWPYIYVYRAMKPAKQENEYDTLKHRLRSRVRRS